MKILFYRYGSICEPDFLEVFEEYGFEVTQITEEITNKNFTPSEGVALVSKILLSQAFDFVFSINFYPFLSEVCNIVKLRYLCQIVDSPIMELYASSIKNPWNRVFLFDKKLYEEIAPMNPECVFYLPLGVNVHQKQDAISCASNKSFSSDISFVGSLYTEKCPYDNFKPDTSYFSGYLNGLIASQLKIYGYYLIDDLITDETAQHFKRCTKQFPNYPYESAQTDRVCVSQYYIASEITVKERLAVLEHLSNLFSVNLYTGSDTSMLSKIHSCGRVKTLTEMPLVFSQSRINLNLTTRSIRSGLPLRIFDILGCGGFCLTNFQPELSDLFSIGTELEAYTSMEELTEKCAYYLEHETKRREIAQNGYEAVCKHHTWQIRLGQMLSYAYPIA